MSPTPLTAMLGDVVRLALTQQRDQWALRIENLADYDLTYVNLTYIGKGSLFVHPRASEVPRLRAHASADQLLTLSDKSANASLQIKIAYRRADTGERSNFEEAFELIFAERQPPVPIPLPPISDPQLRQILSTYFNDGELRDLCFDLGIDYENLPGQAKSDKARELVAYVRRYHRTAELVRMCRALRPHADWSSAPQQHLQQSPAPALNPQATEIKQRRLAALEQRAAYQGVNVDPAITMEIEDLKRELGIAE